MSQYPTKEEILAKKESFNQRTIQTIKTWKKRFFDKNNWQKKENSKTNICLMLLLLKLTSANKKPLKSIHIENEYAYDQKKKIIYIDENKPSILSTLHEFGHHLKGTSELKACRWSYWLFAKYFPKELGKLIWKEHMLVKKNNDMCMCTKRGNKCMLHANEKQQ